MVNKFSVAWLSLTYKCNNQCGWCYASSNSPQENKELPRDKISPILHLLKDLKIKRTILIGGEPTVYPYLKEVLEEHQIQDINTGMVTNGRKLAKREFSKILKDHGVNSLTVSIEGYDPSSHDEVTQVSGSYEESINGIYTAANEGIKVSTNTVITRRNYSNLEKISKSLMDLPIEHLGFNICGPCFGSTDNSSIINPKLAARAFQDTYDYIKLNSNKRIKLVTPMPLCFFNEEHREEFKNQRIIRGGPCQLASGSNFVIDYNGDIIPCTHLTGYPLFNIYKENGELYSRDKFLESVNNPDGIPYRFREIMSKNASEKCDDGNCDEPCSGGCPLVWSVFDPAKEIKGIDASI
ncbi:MAG: radical SAM protein [Nanoarchaeota archaeon]|nr:radical SAM protein [Nanoarchaeota archaeon]